MRSTMTAIALALAATGPALADCNKGGLTKTWDVSVASGVDPVVIFMLITCVQYERDGRKKGASG